MSKAAAHGLQFKDFEIDEGASSSPIHDSFAEMGHGLYRAMKLGRRYYRGIAQASEAEDGKITKTINETIDSGVFERWTSDPRYRPLNLKLWADRSGLDLEKAARADRLFDGGAVPST